MSEKSIEFNKDEVNPPKFLNKEFFENILRKEENDKALKITTFQLKPGTKPGDHFASIMFKAIVSYNSRGKEVNSRSLVVKTMPVEEGVKKDMLKDVPIFDREIDMYTKVLPEMKRIMESVGDYEEMAPRMIYESAQPPIIILEDITKFGYEMHYGFYNFDNAIKVLKKLAKFHALSYYINDNKYNHTIDLTQYKTMMSKKVMENFKVFLEGFEYLKEQAENWPGFEKVAEKLSSQNQTFLDRVIEAYQPNPEPGFNVLCHADFHVRNLMFIKNNGDIDETMFLDFQACFWTSPVLDLFYALYSIGDSECRKRRGEILSIYHKTLSDYLNRIGCLRKPPTLLDLNIEMLRMGAIEMLSSICFFPFFCLDFSKIDMEALVDTSPENVANLRKLMYKNELVVQMAKEVLPDLLYKGILA